MRRARLISPLLVLTLVASDTPAAKKRPGDFKLTVTYEVVGSETTDTGELLFHDGRFFQNVPNSDEVIVIDLENRRVELLDLARQSQARASFDRLDKHIGALRKVLLEKADALDKKGGKANQVAARDTRRLVDAEFKSTFDKAKGELRLVSPITEVDALGVADGDPKRLEVIGTGLLTLIKLGSLRNPRLIPPFTRLDATRDLVVERRLRPVDMAFLYRLAGNAVKYRWTYRLDPRLTQRDLEAIGRLDRFRAAATLLTFDRYEKGDRADTQ